MNKIVITRDNYEEIMFELIEDIYAKDIRNDILDQIQSDTFLSFEWNQWKKALFTESIEVYKKNEAEFIESLIKEEDKKGFIYYLIPFSIAASIIMLFSYVFIFKANNIPEINPIFSKAQNIYAPIIDTISNEIKLIHKQNTIINKSNLMIKEKVQSVASLLNKDSDNIALNNNSIYTESVKDTINNIIASANKKSKFKITVIESVLEENPIVVFPQLDEKRYTMTDVLNKKDGISLSKFLKNSSSRIVTDFATKKVQIEYIAEDNSILVLTLSN